jgi:psp operon transcriptional activator
VFPGFTPAAERLLESHSWPGNVRELKNVVERAIYRATDLDQPIDRIILDPFDSPFRPRPSAVRAPAAIEPAAAPPAPPCATDPYDFFAHIAEIERDRLKAALQACIGNQKRTAAHLGMAYHQLRNLLRKHGMLSVAQNSPQSAEMVEEDEQVD